jgi:hypothetical protein
MQPVFDRATPVVDFGETPSPKNWGVRKWILWPVFAYKVMIPSRGNPPFNIFQRAVLDMCQAGIRTPEQIAKCLGFSNSDLFVSIFEQLQNMDALDTQYSLTERAKRLLADETDVSDVEDVGYVFVDAHNRQLWPRLHRGNLPFINADMEGNRNLSKLTRGNEGSPELVDAIVLWSTQPRLPDEPSAFDVQKAVRHHARRIRTYARERSQNGEGSLEKSKLIAEKVRLLGTEPELVFVAATVFMPKDAHQSSWFMTDPCGLGVSEVLRKSLMKLAKEGKLGVKEMLENLTRQALHVDDDDFTLYLAEANRHAISRVEKLLGNAANMLPPKVLEQLARADGKSQSKKIKDIETFFSEAYAAVEGTFSWLVSLYPNPDVLTSLAPEALSNEPFLRQIAERLGFFTSEKINIFFKISRSVVKGALCNGNTSLPGCVAAALLAANGGSKHPLTPLAVKNAHVLEFLADFKKRRDNASHNNATEVLVADAMQMRRDLFKFFRDLLGSDTVDGVVTDKEVPRDADMSLRIRSLAAKNIETNYSGIDEYPDLHSRLIDMRVTSLVVDKLIGSAIDGQELLKPYLKQLMIDTTIVMEAMFVELEKKAPSLASIAQDISDDRNQNATLLAEAAAALGFKLSHEGKLPQTLTHTKSDSLRKAAYGKVKSLQATVAAQVLSANCQERHPLREIAKTSPEFLLHIGQLVEMRGHGNEVSVTAIEAQQIVELIESDIQLVLTVNL